MNNNIDVDLDALLGAKESGEVETSGASDKNINETESASESVNTLSEESSSRANERIRELVEEVNSLKQSQSVREGNELDTFINSIEDVPSRELLKTYGSLMEKSLEKRFSPVLEEYNSAKFEKEFSGYANKIPDLEAHKEELRKTYLRNPSQSLRNLVGDVLLETQSSKIKPIERVASVANRDKAEVGDASKDELYAMLEQRPPIR